MSLRGLFDKLTGRYSGYEERLVEAFPRSLAKDVRIVSSILPFHRHEIQLTDGQIHHVNDLIHENEYVSQLRGDTIRVPSRLYFDEPDADLASAMTDTQKAVLHSIYSRHHDGYVRQAHLERLVGKEFPFVCPFVVQLLGEYVVEILYVVENVIESVPIAPYKTFLYENPFYWKQTQSRMVSYWNEYYREVFPRLNEYVGKRIVDRFSVVVATAQSEPPNV